MEQTVEKTAEQLRKGCEAARGLYVTVQADDVLAVLDALSGKKSPPPKEIKS